MFRGDTQDGDCDWNEINESPESPRASGLSARTPLPPAFAAGKGESRAKSLNPLDADDSSETWGWDTKEFWLAVGLRIPKISQWGR
jgi:hypothetical protein